MQPLAVILVLLLNACVLADARLDTIHDSLARATKFLASKQDKDGAWRSGVHGSFKDGESLTPLVMTSLFFLQAYDPAGQEAFSRGDAYLFPKGRREEPRAMSFPLYTHTMYVWLAAMTKSDPDRRIYIDWHLERLRKLQLNEAHGWSRNDPDFGGWGYHHHPVKPDPQKPTASPWGTPESNISATVFAIGALKLARIAPDDLAWRDAKVYVERCQNPDGGFVFNPHDAATNKPGADDQGRLHSYGSATADGLRSLIQCGEPIDTARLRAARTWLIEHFDATKNPGDFNDDRKSLAIATKFYWLWSASHAMTRANVTEIDWRKPIIDELLKLQQPDGSWKNPLSDGREDDPLVATSFATAAMLVCMSP